MLLVIELFGRDYAGLWIGVKVHLLAVLDAFALPSTVIGFKLGNLRIARLENLLDYLLGGHPVWPTVHALTASANTTVGVREDCELSQAVSLFLREVSVVIDFS